MSRECMCGAEFFSEVAYRLHVQRKHGSVSYAAWSVL